MSDEAHSSDAFCELGRGNLSSLIQQLHGSFARYIKIHRSFEKTGAVTLGEESPEKPFTLFPSKLPWTVPPGLKSRSRRGLSKSISWEAYEWMHLLWALLNYLEAGSPSSSKAATDAVTRASQGIWTAHHESYARTMYHQVIRYVAHPRGTAGSSSIKINQFLEQIKCSQYDPSVDMNELGTSAMEVDPNRISLPDPSVAGILDPTQHLTGQRLADFLAMPVNIPKVCDRDKDTPACHKVTDENWQAVLRKLYHSNMITFLPKSEVLRDKGKLVKGGLFCVPHKPTSDRLINDRRPANIREDRLNWCQLPCGPLLCQLILEREQSVRASGDDLSNYFYLIKHLDAWHGRNAFGKPF